MPGAKWSLVRRGRMLLLACAALLLAAAAAHADQWSDANLRRAQVNTRLLDLNARRQADGMPFSARVMVPRNQIRRTRTEHGALTNESNALRNQSIAGH